ncbi:MAG: iron-sulfur cluster-binding domain-containing protein [Deltaproteobacteria bacterium]|nr:iron-sulfur cluster-binding domain-containing protein [Deltaproteobacteria bacterium]
MRALRDWGEALARYAPLLRKLAGFTEPAETWDYPAATFRDQRARLLDRLHPDRMRLRVERILVESPSAMTLRTVRTDGPLPVFRAGQYVNLFVELQGVRTARPFSISSAPGSPWLDLTVREVQGGFVSPWLCREVPPGTEIESTGPQGSFHYEPLVDGDRLVFLAGGSGITPFMSMLRHCARTRWPFRVHLVYGSRDPRDVIFGRELAALSRAHPEFTWDLVVSEPPPRWRGRAGLLDAATLLATVGREGLDASRVFVCGPPRMLETVRAALRDLGIPAHRQKWELFGTPDDITRSDLWPRRLGRDAEVEVTVEGHGSFRARASEPLLNSLERHGFALPSLCRSGECSLCRTRLKKGRVIVPAGVLLRQSDVWSGHIHPCASYPIEDVILRLP